VAHNFNIPTVICIYNEGVKGVNFQELKSFINKKFGKIVVRVIRFKKRVVQTKGILFDQIKTNQSFERVAFEDKESCHLILTDKILATYDQDKKLHIRAAIYGFPSVISLAGIVEGPAKPRDYYIYKDRLSSLGVWVIEEPKIKKKFKARFIDYDDKRITKVLKGYISQALFFHITGEPFCADRRCRLFNSHWQEDLIYSQIKTGRFCPRHKGILSTLKKNT